MDSRPLPGSDWSVSASYCVCARALRVSTSGASPETVIVSATLPSCISMSTVAVNSARSSIPVRLTVLKPGSVNVTV